MTKNAKSRANPRRTSLTSTFIDFLGGSFTGGKILKTSLSNEDEAKVQAALDAAAKQHQPS
jgi:hypothetical protein